MTRRAPRTRLLRFGAVALLFAVGCTSIAGLDGLGPQRTHVSEPASATGSAIPGPDGGRPDTHPVRDAGKDGDADLGDATVRPLGGDAGLDSGDDCNLNGTCECQNTSECPAGFSCCMNLCVDTTSDPRNCRECGIPCGATQVCQNGECKCEGLEPDQICEPNKCINFFTDENHCGSCNHACLGGACLGSACQPVVLATGLDEPTGIAVDDVSVFVVTRGTASVKKFVKNDFTALPCSGDMCNHFESPLLDKPVSIVTNASDLNVYIASYGTGGADGKVVAVPKSFVAGAEHLVASAKGPYGLAMAAGTLYFSARNDTRMIAKPGLTTESTPLVTSTSSEGDVTALAIDATNIYFGLQKATASMGVGIFRTPVATPCTDRTCTSVFTAGAMGRPRAIAFNHDYVFWTSDDNTVRRMQKICTTSGTVVPCPVSILAEAQPDPWAIVADDTDVYWANGGDGTVRRTGIYRACRNVGCQAITPRIATGVKGEQTLSLAQDTKAIFITSRSSGSPKSGTVWRLAK